MIGRSLPEYIFIRLCICGLRAIAPISTVYVLASSFTLARGRPPACFYSPWIAAYALAESAFYFLVCLPRGRWLQKAAIHPPLPPRAERQALFERCFSHIGKPDAAAGWFFGEDFSSIKRENMIEWLLWSLFGTSSDILEDELAEELDSYVAQLETLSGNKMQHGRNGKTKSIKVSLDPVITVHRPLLWYSIIGVVDTYTCLRLRSQGFVHYTTGSWLSCFPPRITTLFSKKSPAPDLSYWYRPHRSTTKLPIVFIHGIGIGLWPYLPCFQEVIKAEPDVGIIAIESLAISMRMSKPPLTRDAMLAALTCVLDHHNLARFVIAGHSYGTIIAGHVLGDTKLSPRVAATLLVDPIPFLLFLPAVAYNFVYRAPRGANEWQLWYFASRDPDIARALARHFFWAQNLLWKEDLAGRRVGVVLSGVDQIVNAPEVHRYLTGEDEPQFRWQKDRLEVLWYHDLDHAQVFDSKSTRKPMIDILSAFVSDVHDQNGI